MQAQPLPRGCAGSNSASILLVGPRRAEKNKAVEINTTLRRALAQAERAARDASHEAKMIRAAFRVRREELTVACEEATQRCGLLSDAKTLLAIELADAQARAPACITE